MLRKKIITFCGILFVSCIPVFSQTLKEKAEAGDKNAQYEWGCQCLAAGISKAEQDRLSVIAGLGSKRKGKYQSHYDYGEKNMREAFGWFSKAAEQKHSGAMYYLGKCYHYGYGVHSDMGKAVEWYKQSADVYNNPDAEYALALLYLWGRGVKKDSIEAVDWLLHSAAGGWLLANGLGGYDKKEANDTAEIMLKELCSIKSSKYLRYFLSMLGVLYNEKEDYVNAERYFKESIELGGCLGTVELGLMYFYIVVNTPQLFEYYGRIEDFDLVFENFMFDDNTACVKYSKNKRWANDDNVAYWLEEAIKCGAGSFSYGAMQYTVYDHLLFAYVDGVGTKKNLERAVEISLLYLSDTAVDEGTRYNVQSVLSLALEKTELQSKVFSLCNKMYQEYKKNIHYEKYNDGIIYTAAVLGKCYYKGIGTTKKYDLAFRYLLEAANGGDCESMRLLAACYRYGRGVTVDEVKEKEWLNKAAKCGDWKAIEVLKGKKQ